MHHTLTINSSQLCRMSDGWWKKITRRYKRKKDETQASPEPDAETRKKVRKALEESTVLTPAAQPLERVPSDLKQLRPKHVQHADGGHIHFYKEHLLFGRTVIRKDPITRKFKRSKLGKRRDDFYDGDQLHKEDG